jgi:hypothetical protein
MIRLFNSKPEIKQNNNKVVITLYVYNRKRHYFIHRLKKIIKIFSSKFKTQMSKKVTKSVKNNDFKSFIIKNKQKKRILNVLKNKSIHIVLLYLKKTFNISNLNNLVKSLFLLPINNSVVSKKLLKNIFIYKYYCTMLYFNSYLFNANNLLPLKVILTNIYTRKIELNIVNLKYLYLDSNIFAEAITRKLQDRKKRVLRVLKLGLKLTKQPYFKIHLHKEIVKLHFLFFDKKLNVQSFQNDIATNKYLIYKPYAYKLRLLLYHMKQKIITGIKLQGTGRLTKRLTASRSISKVKYMGSLKNINSSYESISTVMLRGFVKSNLQYVNINNHNRNGSFGTKVSISVY